MILAWLLVDSDSHGLFFVLLIPAVPVAILPHRHSFRLYSFLDNSWMSVFVHVGPCHSNSHRLLFNRFIVAAPVAFVDPPCRDLLSRGLLSARLDSHGFHWSILLLHGLLLSIVQSECCHLLVSVLLDVTPVLFIVFVCFIHLIHSSRGPMLIVSTTTDY
jgi:hypothetical protein